MSTAEKIFKALKLLFGIFLILACGFEFVDADYPHDEEVGPEGARVLVGRKYANA